MNWDRVVMDDGIALRAQIVGPMAAPAVLFMHSVGCDGSLWDNEFAALKADYRVIRYDARGHGRSDAPAVDYRLDRLCRDAVAILDWADAARAHLCGLSLGGTTALGLALSAPERLHGIVLSNSAARLGTPDGWQSRMDAARSKGMEAMADFSMTRFFSDPFRERSPDVVARFRAMFCATAAQGYAGCCAVLRDADFRADLGRIAAPALVIGGWHDSPIPVADAQSLAGGIAGAALQLLPTGHLTNVEAPSLYVAALRSWLALR